MHSDTNHINVSDLCVFQENTKAILYNHVETRHTGLSYNCGKCDFQASYNDEVKVLMVRIHSGTKYKCSKFGFMAMQRKSLKST